MYIPKNLIVKNIGPIEKISYNFSSKVVLLTGENLTDEGQDSNGSGKSFLLEAMCYALIGCSFRKVTDSELVNEEEKEAEIYFELFNKPLNKTITINRYIYNSSKSSKLIIAINGKEQQQITSVNEGNKFILDELGLSREDILNYFFISKEKYTSFFSSSDTAKKELISRFSKADIVEDVFPKIEEDKKVVTDKIIEVERKILKCEASIETLQEEENPEEIEKQKRENQEKIDRYNSEIQQIENSILQEKENEKEYKKSLTLLRQEQTKLKDTSELEKQIKDSSITIASLQNEIKTLKSLETEAREMLGLLEKNLSGVVQCPKCEHEFTASDPDFDVVEGREIKKETIETIKGINADIRVFEDVKKPELQKVIDNLNDEIQKQKRIKNEITIKISTYENKLQNLERTFSNYQNSIENKKVAIKDLENKEFGVNNTEKIKSLKKQLKEFEKELSTLRDKEQYYDNWILNFESFKTFLVNKSLNNITNFTNLYLEKLGSSIRVKFEGHKEVNRGKAKREKINVRIFKFGEDKGNHGKLSGGEKARVEVAVILAISNLINLSSDSGGLDLVIIDEILESLDATGIRSTLKAIQNVDQHVMLVTHGKVESREGFTELRMIKQNNRSTLLIN